MASLDEMLYDVRRIEEHRVELTEKKIKSIYQTLMKDLNFFISEEYVKYADKDGKLFLSYLDSKNKRAKFLEEIVKNVDSISPKVKQEILDMVDKTYEKSYKGIVSAIKAADDTKDLVPSGTLVRPEVLKQAVKNNIEKLTLPAVMEKHRAEIVADIQQTLNIGLMQGDRYETMAKRIQERLGVSYSKATNITRTESHRNIESGLMDGAKETAKIIEKDGNLIYAATWKTMKDQRVRPQQRRKTKKGWITTISKNGANHQKMHDVTIKVGEQFQLEPDVFAECPSMSGTARNDCRCRCFLKYSLMTVEEFAKATKQTEEEVRKKYDMPIDTPEDAPKAEEKAENLDDIYKEYQELVHKYGDKDGLLIMGSGDEIEQYAIYKKKLVNYTPKLTKKMPRSLLKFDDYQKKWVDKHFIMSSKNKRTLQEGIQEVIDNNAYSMRVNARDMQSIIDNGFLNQFETGTSGGTLSAQYRKTASYRLFGNDAQDMSPNEFEKYGYLGSKDFVVDAKTSATGQYGKTIVKFKKDELKDRVTYTVDDSLGNAIHGEVVGGKIGDECSISGVPIYNTDDLLEYFEESDWADIDNADELAQIIGCRYWEIQFHGKLTIDDVDSICYTGRDNPTDEILEQLKEHNVKVYKLKNRNLVEL